MASGKVGDGYIEIHADDGPFKNDMASLMGKAQKALDKQARDVGKTMGDELGKSLRDALGPEMKRIAKDAAKDLHKGLDKDAKKTGRDTGKKVGDGIDEGLSDGVKKAVKNVVDQMEKKLGADTEKKVRPGFRKVGIGIADSLMTGMAKQLAKDRRAEKVLAEQAKKARKVARDASRVAAKDAKQQRWVEKVRKMEEAEYPRINASRERFAKEQAAKYRQRGLNLKNTTESVTKSLIEAAKSGDKALFDRLNERAKHYMLDIDVNFDWEHTKKDVGAFRAYVERAANKVAELKIDADTRHAKKKLDKLKENQKVKFDAEANTGAAAARLAWLARSRKVTLWVNANTKAALGQITALAKGLTGMSALKAWKDSLVGLMESLPQTILRMGGLYGSIASLAGPILNVVGAIAPLASGLWTVAQGAVAAGPALAGMITLAIVAKSAFSDLAHATGEAGRFHTDIDRWSKSWKNVSKDIQKAWFESKRFNNAFVGLGDGVIFTKTFREGLNGVSRSLSDLTSGAMEGFTFAFDKKKARGFLDALATGLDAAAPGFQAIGRAIGLIVTKGAPLFKGMGEQIARWGGSLEKFATNTNIVKMAQDAYATWGVFWRMIKAVGSTVANVFKAMTPPGSTTTRLENMAIVLEKIAEITGGTTFKYAMGRVFAGAAVGAHALAGAMAPIGAALTSLAPTIGRVIGLLGELGAAALTGIAQVIGNMDVQKALEGAVTAIKNMVAGIDFGVVASALATVLKVIAAVAPVVDDLLNAFLSVAQGIISAVLPALQAFSGFMDGNAVAAQALIVTILAVGAAVSAFGVALKGLKLAQSIGGFDSLGAMFTKVKTDAPGASAAVGKFAKGAAKIGGALMAASAAIAILGTVQGSMAQSASTVAGNIDVLTKRGTDLALVNKQISDSLRGDAASRNIQGVGDAVKALGEQARMGTGWFNSMLDSTGFKTQTGVIKDQLGQMDQAISQIATSGDAAGAQEAFRKIGAAATAQGESLAFTATQFPQYQAQLEQTAATMGVAGLSAEQYAAWMGGNVPAAVQTAIANNPALITSLSEQQAALAGVDSLAYSTAMETASVPPKTFAEAVNQATTSLFGFSSAQLQLSGTQMGMEEAFDTAAASAKEYGKTLDVNTAAGRANQQALDGQATASQAYITSLLESKAPAEQVVAAAERSRSAYIKNARAMGASKSEAEGMADAMGLIPSEVNTAVNTDVYGQAQVEALHAEMKRLEDKKVVAEAKGDTTEVKRLQDEINKLHDKEVDITTNTHLNTYINKVYTTKAGTKYEAEGGILGRVKAFARGTEKHVAQIASAGSMRLWAEPETGGEAYIPLAASKRARSLKIWQQTGKYLGVYAGGGGVGGTAAVGRDTIAGLIAGMNGGKGPLSGALVGMMRDAVEDLKNFLGIASPSKLLKGYGLDTSHGLADGVKKGAKKHGPSVSAALRRWVKKYVIDAGDFKKVATIYEGYGEQLTTALAYGIRDNGELLDETTSWLAERSSSIIKKEVDRINSVTAAANKKLTDKKKKANKAEDKVLDAQIKANNKTKDAQIKALEKHNAKVKSLLDKQNSLSNYDIWWKYGDAATGAHKIADALTSGGNWLAGTATNIRNATLADVAKAQESLQDLLDDAIAMRDSVRDNLVGGFELKGLTSLGQLKTTLGKWVGQAKTFATKLRELAKKGYPKSFIQQVAALGFVDGVAVANVLLTASDQEVAAITTDYGELVAQATDIGTVVAETMFSSGQKIQEGLIAGLTSDIAKLEKAAKDIAAALVAAVKKELGIKSPSTVMAGLGGQAVAGFVGGIDAGQAVVAKSMEALTGAATASGGFKVGALGGRQTMPAPAAGAGGTTWNLHINGNLIGANPKVEQAVGLLMEVIGDGRRYERAGWQASSPALMGGR